MANYNITIRVTTTGAQTSVRSLRQETRRLAIDAEYAARSLNRLAQTIAAVVSVRELFQAADAFQNLNNRIQNVAGSTARTYDELLRLSQRTRTDFASTVQIYQRVANATAQYGYTSRNAQAFVEGLNKIVATSGANAREANAAIIQLSQGLGAGALRGEELNSVFEQIPELMRIVARNLHVTTGALRAMAKDGKLTADVLMKSVRDATGEIDDKFGKTMPTLGQRVIVVKNAFLDWFGKMGTSTGIFDKVGQALDYVSKNMGEVIGNLKVLIELVAGAALARGLNLLTRTIQGLFAALSNNPFKLMVTAIAVALPMLIDMAGGLENVIDKLNDISDWARSPISIVTEFEKRTGATRPSTDEVINTLLGPNQYQQVTPQGNLYQNPGAYAAAYATSNTPQHLQINKYGTGYEMEQDADEFAKIYADAFRRAMDENTATLKRMADESTDLINKVIGEASLRNNLDLIDATSSTIGDATAAAVGAQIAAAKEAKDAAKAAATAAKAEWKSFVDSLKRLGDELDPIGAAARELAENLKLLDRRNQNADKLKIDPNASAAGYLASDLGAGRRAEIDTELKALKLTEAENIAVILGSDGKAMLAAQYKIERTNDLLAERAAITSNPYAADTNVIARDEEQRLQLQGGADAAMSAQAAERGQFNNPFGSLDEDIAKVTEETEALNSAWADFDKMIADGTHDMIEQVKAWQTELDKMRDPMEGLKSGWAEFSETVNNAAADMHKAFTDALNGINDAIVELVVNGKLELKSLVDTVLSDLVQALLHRGERSLFTDLGLPGFGAGDEPGAPIGFANGGAAARVGGHGGTDSQLTLMRLSPGEVVEVHRPGDYESNRGAGEGGGDVIVQNSWDEGTMLRTMGSRRGRREVRNANEVDVRALAVMTRAASRRT